ncbi:F-box/LRR-repeat protein 7 [Frankliniella fusca]|uniref:F-box/LRR-repeat protein 7 n=1 Tax=Frankliniella fusca TaxID=407009 RepID=A0AAE1HK92_9NEOP|nr:F-box/LRR-repeat protein 7 [Frankliniella fusca]
MMSADAELLLLLLPDELLLMVLRHLGAPDLLSCRRVCRRLWRLALDPLLWQHQVLDDRESWACAVLQLAPCLRTLTVRWTPLCHREYTVETACAVESLSITVRRAAGFKRACSVIRNQAALGRLRHVSLALEPWDPPFRPFSPHLPGHQFALWLLLQTLANTPGLLELEVRTLRGREHINLGLPKPLAGSVAPSLRRFVCREHSGSGFRDIGLEHTVLRAHAATLEEVNIGSYAMAETSSLLARIPHLRKLTCSLMLHMGQLAGCSKLTDVKFCVPPQRISASLTASVEAFLTEARQLRALTLEFDEYNRKSSKELVKIIAQVAGRSRLESLALLEKKRSKYTVGYDSDTDSENDGGDGFQANVGMGFKTVPLFQPLLQAVRLLSHLRRLEVSRMPEELLEGITPVTAPGLRTLVVTKLSGSTCLHSVLHRPGVMELLKANPQLHVDVSLDDAFPCYFPCEWCRRQCHRNIPDGARVGFFTHDPTDTCTIPEHNSSDQFSCPKWIHISH